MWEGGAGSEGVVGDGGGGGAQELRCARGEGRYHVNGPPFERGVPFEVSL